MKEKKKRNKEQNKKIKEVNSVVDKKKGNDKNKRKNEEKTRNYLDGLYLLGCYHIPLICTRWIKFVFFCKPLKNYLDILWVLPKLFCKIIS